MRVADLTPVELQRLGSAVLRTYLDAGRARQPAQLLRSLLEPHLASGSVHAPETSHADLGPITVLRQGADQVYVAAAGMSPGGGAALVAAELTTGDGVLRLTRVGHVAAARDIEPVQAWMLAPDPPAHLARLLGPLPTTEQGLDKWAIAAAVISDYRETWGIDDPHSAFGPMPPEAREQRDERERALKIAQDLVAEIDNGQSNRPPIAREALGPDLSR